jgi:hypothetical protein
VRHAAGPVLASTSVRPSSAGRGDSDQRRLPEDGRATSRTISSSAIRPIALSITCAGNGCENFAQTLDRATLQ